VDDLDIGVGRFAPGSNGLAAGGGLSVVPARDCATAIYFSIFVVA
jgi:hypothetical protein